MTDFKDLFSVQSQDYAKYRPTYPADLFEYLMTLANPPLRVWDAGTGNGQAAVELAKRFSEVFASDPSEKQIALATRLPNVHYYIEPAEHPTFEEKVNLITVAQAFHWFKHADFARACQQVAAPGCHLAVWSYAMSSVSPEVDRAVDPLYNGLLGDFWEKERRDVENGYRDIQMPFEEIIAPTLPMKVSWSYERFSGYLGTWSALQKYLKTHPAENLRPYFEEIKKAWGNAPVRELSWPLHLRVWKI